MLLDGEAVALTRKAVELALAGDQAALRLCLDRTVAPRRDRAVELALPPIHSADDILAAIKIVSGAVARGAITPGEGFTLSQMIETFLRAIEASDFEGRLRELEEDQAARRAATTGLGGLTRPPAETMRAGAALCSVSMGRRFTRRDALNR